MKSFCLLFLHILFILGGTLLLPQAHAQTPPNAPTGLTIFDRSHVSFQVRWNAPDTAGGAPITGYDVRYRTTAEFQVWPHTEHTTDTTLELTGLALNTAYEVQVRAISADGNSGWSESTFIVTFGWQAPLTLPRDLVISGITGTSFRVSWIPPYTVGDAVLTGYKVTYRVYAVVQGDLEEIIDAGHTGTDPFMVVTGLNTDTSYEVQVVALTSDGKLHYSPHAYLTTSGFRPKPPTGITAARTPESIQLSWNAPLTPTDIPITGYEVRYRPTHIDWVNGIPLLSPFVEVNTTGTGTTIELKDLEPGTAYEIGVRTVVANSKSIWSPIQYVTTRPTFRMDPPTLSDTRPTSFRVNWKTPQFPDDNTIIGYKVGYRQAVVRGNAPTPYTEINTKGTETSLKITGLKPSSSYEIRVQALGSNGDSLWSNPTHTATYSAFPINKPTGLTISDRTSTSLRVSWKTPSAAEGIAITKYKVRYRQTVVRGNAPTPYTEIDTTETTIELKNLTPNTSYEIGVQALSTSATSTWSDPIYTPTYNRFPIDTPTDVTTYELASTSLRVRWNAPKTPDDTTITRYEVNYRRVVIGGASEQPYITVKTKGTETNLKITGLTPITIYEVSVRAISTIGNSLWSPVAYTATAPPPIVITNADVKMDSIIVNELRNAASDTHDWVELKNVSSVDVTFDRWLLRIATGNYNRTLKLPADLTLPAGEVLLLLNTDPNSPNMPLATPEADSHRYLVLPGPCFTAIRLDDDSGEPKCMGGCRRQLLL